MKLIKITNDHYVVVDDSPIKEGDYCTTHLNVIDVGKIHNSYTIFNPQNKEHLDMVKCCKKITHSTLPLEPGLSSSDHTQKDYVFVKPLSLQEVKELIGEADVEKKAEKFIGCKYDDIEDSIDQIGYDSFIRGYNQALEDNKDKKYTEKDLKRYHNIMCLYGNVKGEEYIQSLQPKTEWEIEEIDGKFKLK